MELSLQRPGPSPAEAWAHEGQKCQQPGGVPQLEERADGLELFPDAPELRAGVEIDA